MKTPNAPLFARLLVCGGLGAFEWACKREPAPPDPSSAAPATLTNPACAHAACGEGYFVDAAPAASCAVNETCTLALTLVATGDYHINDEYPYKFRGDEASGVDFQGKSAGGKAVFSKASGDWTKTDEKAGRMSVSFSARDASEKRIAGVFKLSVCSVENCRLEEPRIEGKVAVR
jgi:hypothetical protein